jgi:hypothetical protein
MCLQCKGNEHIKQTVAVYVPMRNKTHVVTDMTDVMVTSHKVHVSCTHALLGLFFDPKDGGAMLIQDVNCLSTDNMELFPR